MHLYLLLGLAVFNKYDCDQSYLLVFSMHCGYHSSWNHQYFSDGK